MCVCVYVSFVNVVCVVTFVVTKNYTSSTILL